MRLLPFRFVFVSVACSGFFGAACLGPGVKEQCITQTDCIGGSVCRAGRCDVTPADGGVHVTGTYGGRAFTLRTAARRTFFETYSCVESVAPCIFGVTEAVLTEGGACPSTKGPIFVAPGAAVLLVTYVKSTYRDGGVVDTLPGNVEARVAIGRAPATCDGGVVELTYSRAKLAVRSTSVLSGGATQRAHR